MRKIAQSVAFAFVGLMLAAAPAGATWIEGCVYCDADGNHEIGAPPDTPINGVVVRATSQDVSPGTAYTDTTGDGIPDPPGVIPGCYRIMLPHNTDDYVVDLTGQGVPPGSNIIIPADGDCFRSIVSGTTNPLNARKKCDFLLDGCLPPTTTSSTTSTTKTTTSTSTSSTPQPTTSSTTSTSSSTSSSSSSTSSTSSSTVTTTTATPTTLPLDVCEETLDHFKCYRTRRGTLFTPTPVTLTDQFEEAGMTVLRPYRLCNPVDKNDEGIIDPTEHQMCYQIRDTVAGPRFRRREVRVTNQFGEHSLIVTRPDTLCTPAEKNDIASDLNLDRFKCYRVTQKFGDKTFVSTTVNLEDQFETKETIVVKPLLLCNPTGLGDEEITDPTCHLVCYKILDTPGQPEFVPVDVSVQDEFNESSVSPFRGQCRQVSVLCVPSLKEEID